MVIEGPALGTVYVRKAYVGNGFYLIFLQPKDAPKFGLVSPLDGSGEELVAILFTLPMGRKNSLPILYTDKETVVDLKNAATCYNQTPHKHKLEKRTDELVTPNSHTLYIVL